MNKTKLFSDFILLLGALIWGFAFVAQRAGMDYIGPHTFNVARYLLATFVLFLYLCLTNRNLFVDLKNNKEKTHNGLIGGFKCGIALFAASAFQQIGLMYTPASKAGFLTALYIITTPLLGIFIGKKVSKKLWLAVGVSLFGMYLLCVKKDFTVAVGDLYLIGCAICFAFQIQWVDAYCSKVDAVFMNMIQFLTASLLSVIPMLIWEQPTMASIKECWIPIFYAGALSGGIAYTLQIVGQKGTDPTSGALIMSLESVFAAIGGFLLLHETMSAKEFIGCVFMFVAIIITQLPDKEK